MTKMLVFILVVAFWVVTGFAATQGTFVDNRDGKKYRTVKIGSQTWMAENLNYKAQDSYCYEDKDSSCSKHGRLYKWNAAKNACPSGWHLPSKVEFETLFESVGGTQLASKSLTSRNGWAIRGNGMDAFGFSALPVGCRGPNGNYDLEGYGAPFWSSTEYDSDNAYNMYLRYSSAGDIQYGDKGYGFSVRCVKE